MHLINSIYLISTDYTFLEPKKIDFVAAALSMKDPH